jgi:hypothetical protein
MSSVVALTGLVHPRRGNRVCTTCGRVSVVVGGTVPVSVSVVGRTVPVSVSVVGGRTVPVSVSVVGGTVPVSVSCACNCVGFSVYAR